MTLTIDHDQEAAPGPAEDNAAAGLPALRAAVPSIIAADKEGLLEALARDIEAFKPDISTATGRDAIRSMAHRVSKVKAELGRKADGLKAEALRLQRAVNAEKSVLDEKMDALRDRVRRDLTEWEDIDRQRLANHETAIAELVKLRDFGSATPTATDIAERLDRLTSYQNRDWQEFRQRASDEYATTFDRLGAQLISARQRERDAEELIEFRKAKVEEARVKAHRDQLATLTGLAVIERGSGPGGAATSYDYRSRIDLLKKPATYDWQEFAEEADAVRAAGIRALEAALSETLAAEAEAQAARERQIAEEAAAAARREAEAAEARAAEAERARAAAEARAEQERVDRIKGDIEAIRFLGQMGPGSSFADGGETGSAAIAARLHTLRQMADRNYAEFVHEADEALHATRDALEAMKAAAETREAEAAEAERVRLERIRDERDQAAAAAALERQRVTALAEQAAAAGRDLARRNGHEAAIRAIEAVAMEPGLAAKSSGAIDGARDRIRQMSDRSWEEFEDRAVAAIGAALVSLEGMWMAAVAREAAEREAHDAALREHERKKVEREQAAADAIAAAEKTARERNRAHRAKIDRKAIDALMVSTNITEQQAALIITAIGRGEIPAVSIAY